MGFILKGFQISTLQLNAPTTTQNIPNVGIPNWKDKNILFSIKLDTWICVPQFYNFIIII